MSPPPTSIDGTDITGATIDGQEVQEITIDGQTVFEPLLIDDFETGNLDSYTVRNSGWGITTSNTFNGQFSAQSSGFDARIDTVNPPGGDVPLFGDDFEFYFRVNGAVNFLLGIESSGGTSSFNFPDGYLFTIEQFNDTFRINLANSNGLADAGSSSRVPFPIVDDRWYNGVVTFSGNTVTFEVIDTTDNTSFGTTSIGSYNSPGNRMSFFHQDGATDVAFDDIRFI
jgi:hypothetical protein